MILPCTAYMSRGNHEGTTGIALYRYESAGNALTERLYLPASTDYGNLRQDINQLCYLSGGQTLYVLMNHAVYSVDLTGKEYMVVADGLTEEILQSARMPPGLRGRMGRIFTVRPSCMS